MMYCTIALYLLGFYAHLRLCGNIHKLEGNKYDVLPAVIASLLWPFVSAYYLVRSMLAV